MVVLAANQDAPIARSRVRNIVTLNFKSMFFAGVVQSPDTTRSMPDGRWWIGAFRVRDIHLQGPTNLRGPQQRERCTPSAEPQKWPYISLQRELDLTSSFWAAIALCRPRQRTRSVANEDSKGVRHIESTSYPCYRAQGTLFHGVLRPYLPCKGLVCCGGQVRKLARASECDGHKCQLNRSSHFVRVPL